MNYYCISYNHGGYHDDIILMHSAYYSKNEFDLLVREAMSFIYEKIKDKDFVVKKQSPELACEVAGYLIIRHHFRQLDTESIQQKVVFTGDYTKDDIAEAIGVNPYTMEYIHKALGSPRMYTSELLEELNKEMKDDYKGKID